VGLRLERLRVATSKTWDAVAADLGIERAMVFHVIAARRGFGDRTLRRFIQCEVAAGIRSEASGVVEQGFLGNDLMAALFGGEGAGESEVTVEDIDAGSKEIALEYRRGSPPAGYTTRLILKAATNAGAWRSIGQQGADEDLPGFLAACVPPLGDKTDLMERLTPSSYARVLNTATDLTFGLNWRAKPGLSPWSPKVDRFRRLIIFRLMTSEPRVLNRVPLRRARHGRIWRWVQSPRCCAANDTSHKIVERA
jgi:hypothetical protein